MLFELTVIVLLVVVNGILAGAEIAVVGIDRARLSQLIEAGGRRARAVQRLRANPERFFATVQIGITVIGATAGAFGGASFARDLEPLLAPWVGSYAEQVGFWLAVVLVSYLSLVIGELVPKSIALRQAERYALFVAPILLWLSSIARPFVWLLTKSSNLFLRWFGDQGTFTESRLSPDELRHMVEEASESGSLDPRLGEIATRALDFARLTAAHVMIPRPRVVGIARDASAKEIRAVVLEYAHSRLPVYEGDLDRIVGYVLYKDLLPLAWQGRLLVLEDLIRPPFVVPETMTAPDLLQQMRERRTPIAIVIDEQGSAAGIVTFDDLIEELVGEVFGELHRSEPPSIVPRPDGSIVVAGDVPIRDLNRELDLELPEGDGWSTIGGLCLFLANAVPAVGTVLRTEDGTELRIESASDRAVQRVRLVPPKPEQDTPPEP